MCINFIKFLKTVHEFKTTIKETQTNLGDIKTILKGALKITEDIENVTEEVNNVIEFYSKQSKKAIREQLSTAMSLEGREKLSHKDFMKSYKKTFETEILFLIDNHTSKQARIAILNIINQQEEYIVDLELQFEKNTFKIDTLNEVKKYLKESILLYHRGYLDLDTSNDDSLENSSNNIRIFCDKQRVIDKLENMLHTYCYTSIEEIDPEIEIDNFNRERSTRVKKFRQYLKSRIRLKKIGKIYKEEISLQLNIDLKKASDNIWEIEDNLNTQCNNFINVLQQLPRQRFAEVLKEEYTVNITDLIHNFNKKKPASNERNKDQNVEKCSKEFNKELNERYLQKENKSKTYQENIQRPIYYDKHSKFLKKEKLKNKLKNTAARIEKSLDYSKSKHSFLNEESKGIIESADKQLSESVEIQNQTSRNIEKTDTSAQCIINEMNLKLNSGYLSPNEKEQEEYSKNETDSESTASNDTTLIADDSISFNSISEQSTSYFTATDQSITLNTPTEDFTPINSVVYKNDATCRKSEAFIISNEVEETSKTSRKDTDEIEESCLVQDKERTDVNKKYKNGIREDKRSTEDKFSLSKSSSLLQNQTESDNSYDETVNQIIPENIFKPTIFNKTIIIDPVLIYADFEQLFTPICDVIAQKSFNYALQSIDESHMTFSRIIDVAANVEQFLNTDCKEIEPKKNNIFINKVIDICTIDLNEDNRIFAKRIAQTFLYSKENRSKLFKILENKFPCIINNVVEGCTQLFKEIQNGKYNIGRHDD